MGDSPDRVTLLAVRGAIEAGWSDDRIISELDFDEELVRSARKAIYAEEIREVRHRPAEEIYADYRIRMLAVADELGVMAKSIHNGIFDKMALDDDTREAGFKPSAKKATDDSRNLNAAVNALKSKANIIHTVAKFGQDMGIIPRAAKQNVTVAGILVGTATDSELVALLSGMGQDAQRLGNRYGDTPMGLLEAPDIYQGEVVEVKVLEGELEAAKSKRPVRRKVV